MCMVAKGRFKSCTSETIESKSLLLSSTEISLYRTFIAILLTHKYKGSRCACSAAEACGDITDFEHPDLEIFATRVAARHSGPLGALLVGTIVIHVTCHLNRVIEPILELNNPISAVHLPQNMCRNFGGMESATASELLLVALSRVVIENWQDVSIRLSMCLDRAINIRSKMYLSIPFK
ncbi:hypothetical protein VFPPC_17392 [Pochonia chlamydosporia 170]|uniref:Uncharacterized protein n=1 Tax=Pochonia chlamydosporia 170 TaxID=1380566 RepID=A0A219AS88_METCM|nr:hypothetical protein VFPPC_17392 [Pochonia chlamydosporia 170]OWT43459.1 hypothetical protein VFPPC_17392 [Pochonia chlamydosporia 170]